MIKDVDRESERVIYRVIHDAKLARQNDKGQNEVAVRTARWMAPDMTLLDALSAVQSVGVDVCQKS